MGIGWKITLKSTLLIQRKIAREGCIIVGEPRVEPVKAIINITDDMLLDASFEEYTPRKRKTKEVTEEPENA